MSSLRRDKSASVAKASSRRFFSRMTCWDFSGFDQRLGSEACFSTSVNCSRTLDASKVLPQSANLVFQSAKLLFQFFDHQDSVFGWNKKRAISAPPLIIAHRYANQSPCSE